MDLSDLDAMLGAAAAPGPSPADVPVQFSTFRGADLIQPTLRCMSLREMAEMVRATEVTAAVAEGLRHPLLKMATFSGPRGDDTLVSITGCELDFDKGDLWPDEAIERLAAAGIVGLVYTSRRHSETFPRIRVVVPFSRPITPAERRGYAAALAEVLGEAVDNCTFTASQAFYYAGVIGNGTRFVEIADRGTWADLVLTPIESGHQDAPAPADDDDDLFRVVVDAKQQREFEADLASGKLESALAAIEREALDYDTVTRIGMALAYAGDKGDAALDLWRRTANRSFWYESMLSGEPQAGGANKGKVATLNGRRANAKSIERHQSKVWNRFRADRKASPVGLGSIYAMAERSGWSRASIALGDLADITTDDLDADLDLDAMLGGSTDVAVVRKESPGTNPDTNWRSSLQLTEKGLLQDTLHNIEFIVWNEPRLYGRLGFNMVKQSLVFVREPAKLKRKERDGKKIRQLEGPIWMLDEPSHLIDGKMWGTDHENALRSVIEAPVSQGGYGIKVSKQNIEAGVRNVAKRNTFHPIRDRLRSFTWDGVPRAETLFVDYLGCKDDEYHRESARLILLGAVARAFHPGHKFDFVPILEGAQGAGKSTFIRILGLDWAGELAVDFHDNNRVIEALMGSWIIEIPELQGFSKAETTVLKATISRTHDKGRLAWERYVGEYPRQCVFFGSTNDSDYLRDSTGSRRFWPIVCKAPVIDTDRLRRDVNQIWAEVMVWFDAMRRDHPKGDLPLFLKDPRSKDAATALQESRRPETPEELLAAEIVRAMAEPVSTEIDGTTTPRTVTCVKEMWVDLLQRDPRDLSNQATTRLLGRALRMAGLEATHAIRHPKYGVQKGYRKA